ncbi:hypothetical protein AAGG74_16735 [Bacillus mexicanus]|uniref:hypothetical protein n=1 Tax=Bacillus mexicanus TaxID=2834415 RepID=UPI003D1BDA40
MIFEETYQYLLHNVSSTEFDVCLYSLLHTDWDGTIQAPISLIASKSGTKIKYLKQIIKRFTSYKRRYVFVPVNTDEGTKYKFNLGPTRNLGFNNKTDRYCKKYTFFYENAFKELSINAKRLLLMAAFRMSTDKNESVYFDYNDIVPSKYSSGIPFFTKGRLMDAIEEIQTSDLNSIVSVSWSSNIFTRKPNVLFQFKKGTLDSYLNNHTERYLLRKKIFQSGFQGHLGDQFCIEIEKIGKYLYNSLLRSEKNNASKGSICDGKDEMLSLARFIYNTAIARLAKSLHSNKHFLDDPKQAAAYFSKIVYDISLDEMAKYAHQSESIKSLLDNDYLHKTISENYEGGNAGFIAIDKHVTPIREKYKLTKHIYSTLKNWCEEWIISRVKSTVDDFKVLSGPSSEEVIDGIKQKRGWTDHTAENAKKYINDLKQFAYEQLNILTNQLSILGNKAINKDKRTNILKEAKEAISSYFAIQTDSLNFLTNE